MLEYAARVALVSLHYGAVRHVPADEARRIHAAGQALRDPEERGKMIKQLFLADHNPKRDAGGFGSNSLRAGYMQTLGGRESLTIETERDLPRQVTTRHCRVYNLKRIATQLAPIYDQVLREVTGHTA